MTNWRDIESAPKGASPIDILCKYKDGIEYIVRDCVWLSPVGTDEKGNDFYCYEDSDWWSVTDDEDHEPDWALYGDAVAIAWRPGRIVHLEAFP